MTLPSDDKLKLIVLSSSRCCWPMFSSLWIFSLPARSHKFSLPRNSIPLASAVSLSTNTWKMVCDLDEWMLDLVCLVILFCSPRLSKVKQSWALLTTYSLWPSTKIPVYLSSLIFSAFEVSRSWNKSYSFSL